MTRLLLITILLLASTSPASAFIRGDANGNGSVELADAVRILVSLFGPNPKPLGCLDAGDVDDDGRLNIVDPIYLLAALFQSGPLPRPPYPDDGIDPTPDNLPPCALGVLPITTIAQGSVSNTEAFTLEVLTDESTWSEFWAGHSGDPLPLVDFDLEMVVVVRGSYSNGGVTYSIDRIEDTGSNVVIDYTVVYPGPPFPTQEQPHHIVRTTRSLNPPIFNETVIALP